MKIMNSKIHRLQPVHYLHTLKGSGFSVFNFLSARRLRATGEPNSAKSSSSPEEL